MASVSFPPDIFDELSQHLQIAEAVAFMRASMPDAVGVFRVQELRMVQSQAYDSRSDDHCTVDDETRAKVIKWAWDSTSCLLEAHSHGLLFSPARFSRFDLVQLAQWVPHVQWRLQGRPYVALVTASRDIDGLAWVNGHAEAVDWIHIDEREDVATTGLSLPAWERLDG
ncbi:MAG: hypothetical protein DLM65_03220 [Candidatus Aeolococcus gillhamiae]|uniref:JAB domain-containing protein n=1 Tax=Candidatus Aeolococcus gillhamiae TaxID=3127015 RepID=A0A2W5ZFL7_9BACT|nr:MAG: hypothetical protein DLM65_03220 [Candidatus Dormibacter sp. RRmetagenome_bin12]